jgi:hypothetical protein
MVMATRASAFYLLACKRLVAIRFSRKGLEIVCFEEYKGASGL